ncbi:alpha/beta hydrolase [Nocardia sp. NPDC051981]|uniref:alpha/beta hydrolase n=1 Tax=Nocardia sp. NPDC051981 TaxID=3155417 RepID=UPI0034410174
MSSYSQVPGSHATTLRRSAHGPAGSIAYHEAGPSDGPLIVFVHGWPGIARTFGPQLDYFAAHGFRVVAPDMRGYGDSAAPVDPSAYAQRHLVADMMALLAHLGRDQAIWVGHDWGSATVWSLAAHHADACSGVVSLAVPYRTLERGIDAMLAYVNRDTYPEDQYPDAQFDYMRYYERHPDRVTALFDAHPERTLKAFYRSGNPDGAGKPGLTATVSHAGGWFGGSAEVPDLPRDERILDTALFEELRGAFARHGFSAATAYYLNHADNLAYSDTAPADGQLEVPALFVGARYDPVADTAHSELARPMRQLCRNLTEVMLDAGHWVGLECAPQVNAAIHNWISTSTVGA